MAESQQSGGGNEGVRQDVEGERDKGRRIAEATPPARPPRPDLRPPPQRPPARSTPRWPR